MDQGHSSDQDRYFTAMTIEISFRSFCDAIELSMSEGVCEKGKFYSDNQRREAATSSGRGKRCTGPC